MTWRMVWIITVLMVWLGPAGVVTAWIVRENLNPEFGVQALAAACLFGLAWPALLALRLWDLFSGG